MTTQHTELARAPLTNLSEDERLFRDSVIEFADREIRPLVRDMDEHAKIPRELIDKLFDLGVMGIEVPESFGGGGASFFHSALAVEAFTSVAKVLGMWVPGALGVQESSIVMLGRLAGLPDPLSVTYALLRRAREILFALVGWLLLYGHETSLRRIKAALIPGTVESSRD